MSAISTSQVTHYPKSAPHPVANLPRPPLLLLGMLTAQAVLAGVGVGSAAATPLSAAWQLFLRDVSGMAGGVLFAAAQGR
jgi:hypothetical protein